MSKMYIRVKKDGFIYPYNELLAKNPGCEVIAEEIAYPENFVKPEVVEKVTRARRKRKYDVSKNLEVSETQEEIYAGNPDINIDASKDLP